MNCWLTILILNLVLCVVLVCRRQHDHPWLWRSFAAILLVDVALFAVSCPDVGGLDLLLVLRTCEVGSVGWIAWYGLVHCLWLSWFGIVLLTSYYIRHGRLPPKIHWSCSLPCLIFFVLAMSPHDRFWFRFVSHVVVEPAALTLAGYHLSRYVGRSIRDGKRVDVLALYLRLCILCLGLRVLIAVRPDYTMVRQVNHALYFVSYGVFVIGYLLDRKVGLWLRRL